MDNTYKINAFCENCDFKGPIDIEKEMEIENYPCHVCGNKKLKKAIEFARIRPNYQDNR